MVWHNVKVVTVSQLWEFSVVDLHTTDHCTTLRSNNTVTLLNIAVFFYFVPLYYNIETWSDRLRQTVPYCWTSNREGLVSKLSSCPAVAPIFFTRWTDEADTLQCLHSFVNSWSYHKRDITLLVTVCTVWQWQWHGTLSLLVKWNEMKVQWF